MYPVIKVAELRNTDPNANTVVCTATNVPSDAPRRRSSFNNAERPTNRHPMRIDVRTAASGSNIEGLLEEVVRPTKDDRVDNGESNFLGIEDLHPFVCILLT